MLARLREAYPDLRVSVTDGEAEQMLPAVLAGDLDVAVVENWDGLPSPTPSGTTRARLCDDIVDLALPATHRLAERGDVALGRVDDLDWVADGGGTRAQAWLFRTLRAVNLEPRVTCTVCGFGMHLELVAGAGVAALVPRLARPPIPAGVRMVTTTPTLGRTIDAVWRTDRNTPAVRAAVSTLRAVAAGTAPAYQASATPTNPDS